MKRKGKGTDTMARVKQAAGAGAEVSPWSQAALPDIELFWVSSKTPAGKLDGRGVAVVAGKLPWLEGDKAMAAIAAAGISDAPTLAHPSPNAAHLEGLRDEDFAGRLRG